MSVAIAASLALHSLVLAAYQPPAKPVPTPTVQGVAIRIGHAAVAQAPTPLSSSSKTVVQPQHVEMPTTMQPIEVAEPVAEKLVPAQASSAKAVAAAVPEPSPRAKPVVDDRPVKDMRRPVAAAKPVESVTKRSAARAVRPNPPPTQHVVLQQPGPASTKPAADTAGAGPGRAAATKASSAIADAWPTERPSLITDPVYRSPPRAPVYPRRAKRFGQQGTVKVRARLSDVGDVLAVEVRQSSGYPLLDEAAVDAVRGWAFEPARRDGRPVLAIVDLPVQFKLQP